MPVFRVALEMEVGKLFTTIAGPSKHSMDELFLFVTIGIVHHSHLMCLDLRLLFCETGGSVWTRASPTLPSAREVEKEHCSGVGAWGRSLKQLVESITFL